jgi:D-cysteine desulfhydrase
MNVHPQEPGRRELAQLPTPVVQLKNLASQFDIDQILLKRDDLTGLETSGNKIRKLEYVVADALARGADTLVTHGGAQSNHCRAAAAIGAKLGLRVRLILRSHEISKPGDGNLFLDHLFGADISCLDPDEYAQNLKQHLDQVLDLERTAHRSPYFFPVGASVPLGCWGYIRCMHELVQQLGRSNRIDLFCATSSGGTQVGLMLGKALFQCDAWNVIGIPVSDSIPYFRQALRKLERETVQDFGLNITETETPIQLLDGFIGEGYAIPFPEAVDTIHQLATREGILLDPSYTAKALTGMLSFIRDGALRPDATPVFLHTGGVFGLMARRDLFSA